MLQRINQPRGKEIPGWGGTTEENTLNLSQIPIDRFLVTRTKCLQEGRDAGGMSLIQKPSTAFTFAAGIPRCLSSSPYSDRPQLYTPTFPKASFLDEALRATLKSWS
ncbi:hypothetical protein RUM44_000580 [Polyplax serrata]|uniref:Uncharacterized protein n=1 Tax=Polyplax serrata TaxID=468196 RepID=A0ABR1B5W0_POLSC